MPMLHEFIATHRGELIRRSQAKVALRTAPRVTDDELTNGVPLFLTHLGEILRKEATHSAADGSEMAEGATQHGRDLLRRGFSIHQVVHDYGDVCQAITELALDLQVPINTEDFHTLNRCLDNAIASAVTEYSRLRDVSSSSAEAKRKGLFTHELRNHLQTAMLAFQAVKTGRVGVTGSTIEVLDRSLRGLRELIDRSVSEVRLASGSHYQQAIHVAEFIEEMGVDASMVAKDRGLHFSVEGVDQKLRVNVDRHLFSSALSNLLQNAFKFTRPSGSVWLRTHSTADHVSIAVEDECGGWVPGAADRAFQSSEQHGTDRSGLGLGLEICRQAVESDGGKISLRDLPGKGCVFTIEMPLVAAPPTVA
jgi:signal transduction histidine kinase